jgi:DUF177 domain-containing protein
VRVNIGELLADRRAVRTLAFSERFESPAEDITLIDPVVGELSLIGTGLTVYLTGRVHTVLNLVCGACLRPFSQRLDFSVDEEFGRVSSPSRGSVDGSAVRGESALGPEDFVVPVGPDEMVDLSEVVRQHLVLALPIAPRCRKECQGLCASCGADLNVKRCRCAQDDIDPRLQVLKQWPSASRNRPTGERK